MTDLTDQEKEMLDVERLWWRYSGAKANEIRERFDLSETQYYQQLNALLDREEALAHDPLLVKRLRRLRAQRQRSRSVARYGHDL